MASVSIRERLQALILKRGWTTREAATHLGISAANVSRLVNGRRGQRMDAYDELAAKIAALERR